MSPSDWLSVFLTAVGGMFGAGVSLWFYRSQQDTDYRKVLDKLDEFRGNELRAIAESLAAMSAKREVEEQIGLKDTLLQLREMVAGLEKEMEFLPSKLASTFSAEQQALLQRVSTELARKVEDSRSTVEDSIRRAVAGIVPSDQQHRLMEQLADLVKYSILTMNKYQMTVLTEETSRSIKAAGEKIKVAVAPAAENVEALQAKLESADAQLALLPSRNEV